MLVNLHCETDRTKANNVAILKGFLTGHFFAVDERAVETTQVFNDPTAIAGKDVSVTSRDTVMMDDDTIGVTPTDDSGTEQFKDATEAKKCQHSFALVGG